MINVKKELVAKLCRETMLENGVRKSVVDDMYFDLMDEPDQYDIGKDVIAMIDAEREAQNLSQYRLAHRSGLSASCLYGIRSGRNTMSLDSLQKLAHGLGKRLVISLEDVKEEKLEIVA